MQGLCYSALDIAVIVSSMQLGCRDESRILDRIWEGEKAFLDIPYRANQRKFILDTYHWLQYFYDKPVIDKEFPAIQKDLAYSNRTLQADQLTSDFSDLDLFFKSIRLRILYIGKQDYVRIKLRTLLKRYGLKRRSQKFIDKFLLCIWFYQLQIYLPGNKECDIRKVNVDDTIIFRIKN